MPPPLDSPCPCCSGKSYKECCSPYHQGALPKTALELMRSRYSAYAYGNADYILKTQRPSQLSPSQEKEQILQFSRTTSFVKLKILSSEEKGDEAIVVFTAYLKQGKTDATFTERSSFIKKEGAWIYTSGEHLEK